MSMGGGTTTSTTTQELSPEQKELLGLALPAVRDISENTPQLFPGSTIAGFDPLQQFAQQLAAQTALGPVAGTANTALNATNFGIGTGAQAAGALPSLTGAAGQANPAFQFLTSGALLDPNTNPVLGAQSAAAIQPIADQLMNRILPGITNQAVADGAVGGSRQGVAQGLAIQDFLRQAGNITTGIQNNAFNTGLGAMTNAVGQGFGATSSGVGQGLNFGLQSLLNAPNAVEMSLLPPDIINSIGQQRQQLSQAQLSEEAQRFLNEQIMPFLVAQDIASLAFGIPGGTVTSSQQTQTNPLQTILGLGSLALGFI